MANRFPFVQLFGPQRYAWMYGSAGKRPPVVGPNPAPILAQWQPPPLQWVGGRQPYAGRRLPPALLDQATPADNPPFSARRPLPAIIAAWQPPPPMPQRTQSVKLVIDGTAVVNNPPFSARRPLPGILAAWQPGPPMPTRSGPIVVALTPSPVLIELNTASDTGTPGDFITSDTSPDIDVTPTEPLQENDIAKTYDAGVLLGSHNITAAEALAATWPMGLSPLSLGAHTLTVTITRNGAESAPSNILSLTMIADNPPFSARRPLPSILAMWQPAAPALYRRSPTAPITPAGPDSVSGLWSWQKAGAGTFTDSSLTTAATQDDDRLGGWQDQSGNARNWIQATGADRPTLKTGIVNGLPIIRGDGPVGGDYLNGPDMSALTEAEMFVVVKVAHDPALGGGSGAYAWKFGTSAFSEAIPFDDGVVYDGWGSTTRKTTGDPTLSLSSAFRLYNVVSASGEWTSFIDGTQHFTTATNTVGFSSTPTLFKSVDANERWAADVAEMIVYDHKLSGADKATAKAYIAAKYGLTIA